MGEGHDIWAKVRVTDDGLVDALARFLERSGCDVRSTSGAELEVRTGAFAFGANADLLELDLYLRLWEAATGAIAVRVA